MEDTIWTTKPYHNQFKQTSKIPKAWKDEKKERFQQWEKGYKPSQFINQTKSFQGNNFNNNNF